MVWQTDETHPFSIFTPLASILQSQTEVSSLLVFYLLIFHFIVFLCLPSMKNPLDLNNLPEDSIRDGKQNFEDSSPSGYRKKKNGGKEGKDESEKVYECRFCSLKFCKSQALGGHMNRHRQERETETLNEARRLVFSNDNLAAQGPIHLGTKESCQTFAPGCYHAGGNMGYATLPFRSVYPSRLISGSPSTIQPQPMPPQQPGQQYLYGSPSRFVSYPSQYPPHHVYNNYCNATDSGGYTCIGAPVGHGGGGLGLGSGGGGNRDMTLNNNQEEGLNWGRSYSDPSLINRFQDGF